MPNIAEMNKMFYDLNWVIILHKYIQVNFCISNTDISNIMQVSKWDDGPNCFYYIYDLRNPGISNTLISNTLLISK